MQAKRSNDEIASQYTYQARICPLGTSMQALYGIAQTPAVVDQLR